VTILDKLLGKFRKDAIEVSKDDLTAKDIIRAVNLAALPPVSPVGSHEGKSMQLLKMLLSAKADTTVTSTTYAKNGHLIMASKAVTPLFVAAVCGSVEVVELLLSAGAALEAEKNILEAVAKEGHIDVLKLLLRNGGDTAKDDLSETMLDAAVKSGSLDMVEAVLGAGWTIKKKDTLLIDAVSQGKPAIIQVLIDHGASVHAMDTTFRRSPLGNAVAGRLSDVVGVLLKAKADANTVGFMDETVLMAAAKNGDVATVELLLEAGADKNAKGFMSKTALQVASSEEVKDLLH